MKRMGLLVGLVCWPVTTSLAQGDDPIRYELHRDVVLRALVDELERGKVGLMLEDLARPYFLEYALVDQTSVSISAVLGAVTNRSEDRSRRLRTDLRVGSYELDNTNFRGGGWGFGDFMFRSFGGASVPLEDDYNAIRQAVWWETDKKYKEAAETLVKKIAFMESKNIEDKPNDFSREESARHFDPRVDMKLDAPRLEKLAVRLSEVFRDYADVQESGVRVFGGRANHYLVNSEGTLLRLARTRYSVSVEATVQAEDGMKLTGTFSEDVRKLDDWPSPDELTGRCREMIDELLAVRVAPKLESYTGPVLFDKEAAAAIFLKHFRNKFTGGQRPVGGRRQADDFEKKLGKRILPRWMDVVDDPLQTEIDGRVVMGHYLYDDQGIKARPVRLVEHGRLKALLMSRNPSRAFDKSTGHGRGSYRISASVGCLIVEVEDGLDEDALKEELIEACQDEDLEYGIRIASFVGRQGRSFGFEGFPFSFDMFDFGGGFGGRRGNTPLVMYKVYPDGREELVRGAEIAEFDIKAFKRMLAAGKDRCVLNKTGPPPRTVVAPAMLFEELDLAKIDRDFDKPPILEAPLARAKSE
jgi:predicted Zn-dependent protease